ncbi:polymeric immunoglobulin receptor-like [Lissotriton helveticus]
MRILIALVFIFSTAGGQALTGPEEVTGTLGGSVSVECSYEAGCRDSDKYWCRGTSRFCDTVIKTSVSEREARKGRVTIRDSPQTGTFTVVMEGLRLDDAGSYQCGIDRTAELDHMVPVSVGVLRAGGQALTGPEEVSGTLGGSVSVECRYDAEYRDSHKYWCRQTTRLCGNLVQTSLSAREVREGRVTIRDSPQTGTFTVVMEGLRLEDAGSYRCGINRLGSLYVQIPVSVAVLTEPNKTQPPVTATGYSIFDDKGTVQMEEGPSFTVFNAIQVAQIVVLLLSVTVASLLCKRGTSQSTAIDSREYVNT